MNRNCHLLQLPLHLIWKFTTDWSDIFFATARHTSHLAIKKYAAFALFWYGYTLLEACTGRFHYMGGTQYSGVAAGAFPPQVVWRGELSNIAWGETMERISSGMRGKTDAAPYWGCLPLFSPLWREEQSLQFPTSSKEIVAFIWLVITTRSGMRERGGGVPCPAPDKGRCHFALLSLNSRNHACQGRVVLGQSCSSPMGAADAGWWPLSGAHHTVLYHHESPF